MITQDNIFNQPIFKNCIFNLTILEKGEHSLIRNVAKDYGIDEIELTISQFLQFDINVLKKSKKSNREKLQSICLKLKTEINLLSEEAIKANALEKSIIRYNGEQSLDWAEVDNKLRHSINSLRNSLCEKDLIILNNRFGFSGYRQNTLEDVSKLFEPKLTRERIRQLEARIIRELISFMLVSRRYLIYKINQEEEKDIVKCLPKYFSLFSDIDNGIMFLAYICKANLSDFKLNFYPSYFVSDINDIFIEKKAPIAHDELSLEIQERLGYNCRLANNVINANIEAGTLLKKDELTYIPKKLSSEQAILQSMMKINKSAHFSEIYKCANEQNFKKSLFNTNRIDQAMSVCVDKNHIYLSDKGTYALWDKNLKQEYIESILDKAEDVLKNSNENQLNLYADLYLTQLPFEDYYIIRHIVRNFGESRSIFFSGKSNTDTISLNESFDLVGQNKMIPILLEKSTKPLYHDELYSKSGFNGYGYFNLEISRLKNKGIISQTQNKYYLSENLYSNINIENLIYDINEIVKNSNVPVHLSVLIKMLSIDHNLNKDAGWVKGLIIYALNKNKLDWFHHGQFISNKEIENLSITSLVLKYMREKDESNYIREKIKEECLILDKSLTNIIRQRKNITEKRKDKE